jgi:ABC-type amino acid transport substrate-binding protein
MWLRVYIVVSSLALVALATAAFRQAARPQNLGEITVERINVVDKDGTLRMVISDKDRQHPGILDGKVIDRPRPVAGLLFFNDEGDEVGGLTYSGRVAGGQRTAQAGVTFDQLKQDQTIGLRYGESNSQRTAALEVWDRSDRPLSELIDRLNAANRLGDPAGREAAIRAARAAAPPGPRRVFVGKNGERAATVSLADANGQPRLTLTVDADGNPRIEFLDEAGKVVRRLPD